VECQEQLERENRGVALGNNPQFMDSAENLTHEDEDRQRKTSAREKRNNQNESTSQKRIKKQAPPSRITVKRRIDINGDAIDFKILNS